jgi:hypothetical protein
MTRLAISIALCIALSSCQSYQPPGQDLYKALQYSNP